MVEKKTYINGLKINYKLLGSGQPILILHGWGSSSNSWEEVGEILSKEYKVLIPDLPGFGKSSVPFKTWSLKGYADFVLKFSKNLEISQFHLLGHSFGGRVAIKFAILHPEKIKKLILCNAAGIKLEPGIKTRFLFFLSQIGNAIFSKRHLVRFKDGAKNLYYFFLKNKDYVKANGVMKEIMKEVIKEDLLPQLPEITNQTLIIWGKEDKILPSKYAFLFKEKIKNSKLVIIPKVDHSPNLEAPEKLSQIVSNFLKE